mmetsp:Transcript_80261/g.173500  ORF Transcript_80261/g.173500 Transcript_80261/m.173500 type:complete len:260 (+) Transcript_80261:387-1166(+)
MFFGFTRVLLIITFLPFASTFVSSLGSFLLSETDLAVGSMTVSLIVLGLVGLVGVTSFSALCSCSVLFSCLAFSFNVSLILAFLVSLYLDCLISSPFDSPIFSTLNESLNIGSNWDTFFLVTFSFLSDFSTMTSSTLESSMMSTHCRPPMPPIPPLEMLISFSLERSRSTSRMVCYSSTVCSCWVSEKLILRFMCLSFFFLVFIVLFLFKLICFSSFSLISAYLMTACVFLGSSSITFFMFKVALTKSLTLHWACARRY